MPFGVIVQDVVSAAAEQSGAAGRLAALAAGALEGYALRRRRSCGRCIGIHQSLNRNEWRNIRVAPLRFPPPAADLISEAFARTDATSEGRTR